MPFIINPNDIKFKPNESPISEYSWNSSGNLGKEIDLKEMNCNIRVLEKGKFSYPYHYHHNAEELFVVISGKGELRKEILHFSKKVNLELTNFIILI